MQKAISKLLVFKRDTQQTHQPMTLQTSVQAP